MKSVEEYKQRVMRFPTAEYGRPAGQTAGTRCVTRNVCALAEGRGIIQVTKELNNIFGQ